MSVALLDRVSALITAAGLMAGYTEKYFKWTDSDINGKNPFIVLRQSGSGISNILLQQTDVLIQLSQVPTAIEAGDLRMKDILLLFRGQTVSTDIVRFDPIGTVLGPFYLENGRPIWELTVRCFTEDQ